MPIIEIWFQDFHVPGHPWVSSECCVNVPAETGADQTCFSRGASLLWGSFFILIYGKELKYMLPGVSPLFSPGKQTTYINKEGWKNKVFRI